MCTRRTQKVSKATATQARLLYLMERFRLSNAANISLECCVDPKSVTRTVGRLVRDGFVMRGRSASDRRVVELVLTARGRAAASRVAEIFSEVSDEVLVGCTVDEIEAFKAMLRRIIELNAARNLAPGPPPEYHSA